MSLEGTARFIALLDENPLFVFDGDLLWREHEPLILPNEMCGQTFLVKTKLDADIFQYIRSALDLPNPARD